MGGGRIEAKVGRRVPETETLWTCVTENRKVSRGSIPNGGTEEVHAIRRFNVASGPGQIIPDRVVNPNPASGVMAARKLRVEVVEAGAEEREDVERPVQPATELLPVFELVVGLAINGFDCPRMEGVAKVILFFSG